MRTEGEPCLVHASTSPMSPRALPWSRTFPGRVSNAEAVTTRRAGAAVAVAALAATRLPLARCTTWATLARAAPSILSSPTPNIAAATAVATSASICPAWPCPNACTPAAPSSWPSAWSPRTACLIKPPAGTCGATTASSSPMPPSRTGSRPRGTKLRATLSGAYLDNALADFSGYLAIDEVYDGPFCVLSAVDNRRYKRLAFRALDHDPTQDDVLAFLSELKGQLDERGLRVRGITTDGSSLYPRALKGLWPGVRHQLCTFHVLKEIVKAAMHALAKLRKEMTAQIPKQPRGRPSKERQGQAWLVAYRKRRVAELFEHRYLFVRHHLSAAQQKQLRELMYGRPELRTLRKIMDEVYRLFDRRCRTKTALKKLRRLRRRVRRFKKLGQALNKLQDQDGLEKAPEVAETSAAVQEAGPGAEQAQEP